MQPREQHDGLVGVRRLAAGTAFLTAAVALAGVPTRVYYVDKSGSANGDGSNWNSAFRDLQDAINAAARSTNQPSNFEIRVAQGTYVPDRGTLNRELSFDFGLWLASGTTLTVLGSFMGRGSEDPDRQDFVTARTILSGDLKGDDAPGFAHREDNSLTIATFLTIDGNAVFQGLTFRGGFCNANPFGRHGASGLQASLNSVAEGRLVIDHCAFEDNFAADDHGGGLWTYSSSLNVFDTTFRQNQTASGQGGGAFVYVKTIGYSNITRCVFEANSALRGGGVSLGSWLSVNQSVFVGNHSDDSGGAAFGGAAFGASLFLRNSAGVEGGAIGSIGDAGLSYCTVAENHAPTAPAISVRSGSLTLRSSIVWNTLSDSLASPCIRILGSTSATSIWNNLVQGGQGAIECVGVQPGFGAILDSNPQFIRPASVSALNQEWIHWNYRLRATSPACALTYYPGGVDMDGLYLPWGSQEADLGCYFASGRPCPADIDQEYPIRVDDADFAIFVDAYNLMISPPADSRADLNRDGLVDDSDFSLFVVAYSAMLCP